MGLPDLIWWTVAAACGLGGIALVLWALFHDRARGRRRCPRCWYALTGLPGRRCPECGREAKSDRQLLRTRRRWKWAFAGTAVVALGFVSLAIREVQRHGWVDATPTAAYILLLPHLDETTTFDAIRRRVNNGELRQWEYRMLVNRAIGVLRNLENEPEVLMRTARLLASVELGRNRMRDRPWASWASASEFNLHGCLDVLVGLLDHDDVEVRVQGMRALGQFIYKAKPALPALLGQLASDDEELWKAAQHAVLLLGHSTDHGVWAPHEITFPRSDGRPEIDRDLLAEFGPCRIDADCARAIAERELTNPDPVNRALAVYVLTILHGDDPDVHRVILEFADDPDDNVRWVALSATTVIPLDERVEQVLRGALRDPEERGKSGALQAIARRGAEGAVFLDYVHAIMQAGHHFDAETAARCYVRIGGDPHVAVEALLELIELDRFSWSGRSPRKIDTLGMLKVDSPLACKVLKPLFDDDDPEMRSAAATAYIRLGGVDLDAATRVIFEAAIAAVGQPEFGMTMGRRTWVAWDGRFSHEVLRSMLQSDDATERARAARFLGEAGAAAAPLLPELRRLLDDPDPRVQRWAPDAVRRVKYLSREQR